MTVRRSVRRPARATQRRRHRPRAEVEELCERPFPISVNLDDMAEALSGERNATVETIGFGVVAQKHEHGTVAGRVGQTGAGTDVDLPSRKAATNRRNAADLIEPLHPPTGRVLSDRTGGSDKGEAPREEISEKATRGESKSESRRSAIWVAASLTVRVMPDTKPSRSSSTRTGTMAAPSPAEPGVGIDRHDGDTPRRCGGTERTTGGDDDDRMSRVQRSLGRSDDTWVVTRRRYDDGKGAIAHPRWAASSRGHDRHGGTQFADRLDHITGDRAPPVPRTTTDSIPSASGSWSTSAAATAMSRSWSGRCRTDSRRSSVAMDSVAEGRRDPLGLSLSVRRACSSSAPSIASSAA